MAKGFFDTLQFTSDEEKVPEEDGIHKARSMIAKRLADQLEIFVTNKDISNKGRGKWFQVTGDTVFLHVYYRHHTLAFGPEQQQAIKIPKDAFVDTLKAMIEGVKAGDIDEEIEVVDQKVGEEKAAKANTEEQAAALTKTTGKLHTLMRRRNKSVNHGYYMVLEDGTKVEIDVKSQK